MWFNDLGQCKEREFVSMSVYIQCSENKIKEQCLGAHNCTSLFATGGKQYGKYDFLSRLSISRLFCS
jgi:hypothetical protein